MCKSIYSPEVMIDAIELGKQIGMLKASQKLHIPYTTAVNWRKVYNHPEAFPSHAITNVTKEIKGSYEQLRNNSRSYMPEFRAFAVALANKIGKKEAAAELGLKNSQIAHWIGDEKYAKSRIDLKKKQEAEWTRKRSEQLKALQEENDKLRQYISNNIIDSILQN